MQMKTRRRRIEAGFAYHIINRGVERRRLFFDDADFDRFESLIGDVHDRIPLPIKTYELMPNHWHFVVVPQDDDQASRFFQLLAGTHAKRFRSRNRKSGLGHVYQDRFKSFPVQDDEHFLDVCRYVERNAVRARLVVSAEDWPWGGLSKRLHGPPEWLDDEWPVLRPSDWLQLVNTPMFQTELDAIRDCVRRGRPLGTPGWVDQCAQQLDLESTLRETGRRRWPSP
jgi:putative transposase